MHWQSKYIVKELCSDFYAQIAIRTFLDYAFINYFSDP